MINLKEVDISPNIAHSGSARRTKVLTLPPEDEQGLDVSEE